MRMLKPYILPILCGYLFYLVITIFWGFMLARDDPFFNSWLMSALLPENESLYTFISFLRDFLINFLLAIPFALAYLKLNSRQKLISLTIVVVPCFLYEYKYVLTNFGDVVDILISSMGFYYGLVITLLLFPFTVWVTAIIKNRIVCHNLNQKCRHTAPCLCGQCNHTHRN